MLEELHKAGVLDEDELNAELSRLTSEQMEN